MSLRPGWRIAEVDPETASRMLLNHQPIDKAVVDTLALRPEVVVVGACLAVVSLGRHGRRRDDLDGGPQRLDRYRLCKISPNLL